jgi:anti-sigma28 factor (negative regulator of flagellin synthesis)
MPRKETIMKQRDPKQSREALIESLRKQLASGSYQVNSSALAQALIEHMQQKQRRAA